MAEPGKSKDFLGMSDEDFQNINSPGSESEPVSTEPNQDEGTEDPSNPTPTPAGEAAAPEDPAAGGDPIGAEGETGEENNQPAESTPTAPEGEQTGEQAPADGEASPTGSNPEGEKPTGEVSEPDYKAVYDKIMAPFNANGKQIKLNDPEEAIKLMQMGANYTRKMNAIAPHRKMLMMLQNNGLLDEGKISYLIDLDKKNPEAIKKLVKESGIDPLDIDVNTDPDYQEGSYQVTDEEVAFRTTLEDLTSTDEGKQTLSTINTTWDDTSKEMLWSHPEIMPIIQQQQETGVYAIIADEIDRQRTLGKIAPETPFLQAYKIVGDQLTASGGFNHLADPSQGPAPSGGNPVGQTGSQPLAVRPAEPKKSLSNDDKASAASVPRSGPKPAKSTINPLAMSDDEFLKLDQFKGL